MSYAQNTISIAPMQENLKSPAQEFVESLIETYNPATVLPVVGDDGLYHFIYLTYHKETYKFYLGKHTTLSLEDGYLGSGTHFKRALKRHGSLFFTHVRLSFLATEEEAYKAEEKLITAEVIKKYREQLKVCYNLKAGGFGGSIYLSEETRAKHSKAIKEALANPETKTKHSKAVKEAMANPETKAKHREAWANPETKTKHSKAVKEAMANPETKAKLREAWANPETKAKKSKAMKEARANPKTKAKYKEAWANPEYKAKKSKAMKDALANPKTKAKYKEAMAKPEYKAKLREAWANPETKAKKSKVIKDALAIKELISLTGEKKEVHWEKMTPLLKAGWQLTVTQLRLYNPKDNNSRTTVAFERKGRKIDKKKAYERLISLLEDGWQVGYPPTLPMPVPGVGGVEEEVEVEEARLEAWGDLMNFLASL